MLKFAIVSLGVLCTTGAFADEVDIHAGPGPAVVAPDGPRDADSKTVVREHEGGAGCASTTVHKENDVGDSKTVKKTDC